MGASSVSFRHNFSWDRPLWEIICKFFSFRVNSKGFVFLGSEQEITKIVPFIKMTKKHEAVLIHVPYLSGYKTEFCPSRTTSNN